MGSGVNHLLLRLGWKFPYIRLSCSRKAVILYYHGIPKKGCGGQISSTEFEQQIIFLKQHFELVAPDRLRDKRNLLDKISVMLTFDDGFRNHAAVVAPILRRFNVPALFFVSSRHSIPGKCLWFSYLSALEKYFWGNGFYCHGEFINMSLDQRQLSLQRLREFLLGLTPHPAAMYQVIEEELPRLEDFVDRDDIEDCYAGMSAEQVGELASDPLFTVGVHTKDHPFLTQCEHEEAYRQIEENKSWIERAAQRKCDAIAYPGGDYNFDVLKQCDQFGFTRGYAITPLSGHFPELEWPRIGIHSASLDILGFKVQWGNLLRAARVKIG